MKTVFTIVGVLLLGMFSFRGTITPDEASEFTEKSVLLWADKTFEFYDGARFENFHEIPSQEQFILENKVMAMQEFMADQEAAFKAGQSKKTQAEFDVAQKKLSRKVDSLQTLLNNVDPSAKNYEVHFWANILVSNAVTVYYQHLVKLDSKFNVMSTKITGKVGTQPDGVKILYKKTAVK